MNYYYRITLLIISCTLLLTSCNKELGPYEPAEDEEITPINPFIDKTIEADVSGQIMDETGNYLGGVIVKVGSIAVTTGDDGIFEIKKAKLGKEFGLITAEKPGYFLGKRTILTNPDQINYIKLQLMPRKQAGLLDARTGGEIIIDAGTKLVFDANSIIKVTDSSSYSGKVTVYASLTDASSEKFIYQKTGDMRAISLEGSLVYLSATLKYSLLELL